MIYQVTEWQHGESTSDFGRIEADSPREAIATSGALDDNPNCCQYTADANGAGSWNDPDNPEWFVEAVPTLSD